MQTATIIINIAMIVINSLFLVGIIGDIKGLKPGWFYIGVIILIDLIDSVIKVAEVIK